MLKYFACASYSFSAIHILIKHGIFEKMCKIEKMITENRKISFITRNKEILDCDKISC